MIKKEDVNIQEYNKSDNENIAVGIYLVDRLINGNGGWILQSIDNWNYYESVIADEDFLKKLSTNPDMLTVGDKIICSCKIANLTDGNNFLLVLRVYDHIFLAQAYEKYSTRIKDLLAAKKSLGSAITYAYQYGVSLKDLTNIGVSPNRIQIYCHGEKIETNPNNSRIYLADVEKKIINLHQAEEELKTAENIFRPLIEEYISYNISMTSLAGIMKEKNPRITEENKTIVTTIYNMLHKKQNNDDKYFYAYCLHKYYGWKFTEISRIIDKNKSTGLRWVQRGKEIASEKKRTPKPSEHECIHHLTAALHEN